MKRKERISRQENKIEPFEINDSQLEDPDMDKFLKKSIIQEADEIEHELNTDPELTGMGASDDLFLKIKEQLKEMGVWEEKTKEEGGEKEERAERERGERKEERERGEGREERRKKEGHGKREEKDEVEKREERKEEDREKREEKREPRSSIDNGEETEWLVIEGKKIEDGAENETDEMWDMEKKKGEEGQEGKDLNQGELDQRRQMQQLREQDGEDIGDERENIQKKEDVYDLLSEEDREALELGKKLKRKKKKRVKRWKQLVAAVVTIVVVCNVGMSGEASRSWILSMWEKIEVIAGFRVPIDIENEQENVKMNKEKEKDAWTEIKDKMNIPTLEFGYKPKNMVFDRLEIIESGEIWMFYKCYDKIFSIQIEQGEKSSSISFLSDTDTFFKEKVINPQNMEIEIWDTTYNMTESYTSMIKDEDVMYFFSGQLPYKEMKKMMENIYLY